MGVETDLISFWQFKLMDLIHVRLQINSKFELIMETIFWNRL